LTAAVKCNRSRSVSSNIDTKVAAGQLEWRTFVPVATRSGQWTIRSIALLDWSRRAICSCCESTAAAFCFIHGHAIPLHGSIQSTRLLSLDSSDGASPPIDPSFNRVRQLFIGSCISPLFFLISPPHALVLERRQASASHIRRAEWEPEIAESVRGWQRKAFR
jgi:hypothetical protein